MGVKKSLRELEELTASTHSDKGTEAADGATQVEPLSVDLRQALVGSLLVLGYMGITGVVVLLCRLRLAHRWASLLETSSFADWLPIDGLHTQIVTAYFPIVAGGLAIIVGLLSCCTALRRRELLVISHLILLVAIAAAVGLVVFPFGWLFAGGISDDVVSVLATQPVAVTNFIRDYCQAWCRQEDTGVAALMRGECGPNTPTVFDEIVDDFAAEDWCKQAIATQNFDGVATYDGISPFAGLKGQGGRQLTSTFGADFLALFSGVVGMCLFALWYAVRGNLPSV